MTILVLPANKFDKNLNDCKLNAYRIDMHHQLKHKEIF